MAVKEEVKEVDALVAEVKEAEGLEEVDLVEVVKEEGDNVCVACVCEDYEDGDCEGYVDDERVSNCHDNRHTFLLGMCCQGPHMNGKVFDNTNRTDPKHNPRCTRNKKDENLSKSSGYHHLDGANVSKSFHCLQLFHFQLR